MLNHTDSYPVRQTLELIIMSELHLYSIPGEQLKYVPTQQGILLNDKMSAWPLIHPYDSRKRES